MASHAAGYEIKGFGKLEGTFDTHTDFAATDAVSPLEDGPIEFEPNKVWDENKELDGSASHGGFIEGREGGTFSGSFNVKPAAAGTAPDIDPILEAAYGTKTVNGGVSVAYSLNKDARKSLQIGQHAGADYQMCSGAIVEQLDIDIPQNGVPKFSVQGPFARYGLARGATVGAAGALSGATVVPVTAPMIYNFRAGGVVTIGVSTLRRIASVSYSGATVTLASALGADCVSGDSIVPASPSLTLGGTPLGAINCGLTIDAVSYGFQSAKISHKTMLTLRDNEASSGRPTGVMRKGKRLIEVELTFFLLDRESANLAGRGWRGAAAASSVTIRVGPDVAGSRAKFAFPKLFWMAAPVKVPGADVATFTVKGVANYTTADDEHTLTFD